MLVAIEIPHKFSKIPYWAVVLKNLWGLRGIQVLVIYTVFMPNLEKIHTLLFNLSCFFDIAMACAYDWGNSLVLGLWLKDLNGITWAYGWRIWIQSLELQYSESQTKKFLDFWRQSGFLQFYLKMLQILNSKVILALDIW